jgi:YVTN family beta-propeller protein/adhesin HecA-like repeat protein
MSKSKYRIFAFLLILLQVTLPVACLADPIASTLTNLDLGSTERTVRDAQFQPVTGAIRVGAQSRIVSSQDLLTPAEHVALQQVMTTGRQNLQLSSVGAAVGGQVNLATASAVAGLTALTVPSGVHAIFDFAGNPVLSISGAFNNYGIFESVSSSSALNTASIVAQSIINHPGAAIVSKLDLHLTAVQNLLNAGVISSTGNILINASTISNSGLIESQLGNLTVSSQSLNLLQVNNLGGQFSALNGQVNFFANQLTDGGRLELNGGSVLAQEINLASADGEIAAVLDQISGLVNSSGHAAHLFAQAPQLTLGSIDITGDPVYYNSGDIVLAGDIVVAEKLAILGKNISSTAGLTKIEARDPGGQGYDIQIIAGAQLSPACGSCSNDGAAGTHSISAVSLDPANAIGGNIDFSNSPNLKIDSSSTCLNCSGGSVTMAAFANGANGGRITLPAGSEVKTSGSGAGNNGNVTIIAGAAGGTSITVGTITANGGAGADPTTGNVSLVTAQPTTSNGGPMTFSVQGAVTSGNKIVAEATLQPASILLHGTAGTIPNVRSEVIADVNTGGGYQGVALNSSGTLAYLGHRFGSSVAVLDTQTNTIISTITIGATPQGIAVTPDDTRVYAASNSSGTVSVIDTVTNTVVATITLAPGLSGVDISSDGQYVYVANRNLNNVTVIDAATNTVVTTISVGAFPLGVAAHPTASLIYVGNVNGGTISVIDTTTNTVTGTIPTTGQPTFVSVDPSGQLLYATSLTTSTAFAIRTSDNKVIATIPVGGNPLGVDFSTDGKLAYVVNANSSSISIIDTSTHKVKETVPVGFSPRTFGNFVGIQANEPVAYITNLFDDHLSVVKTPTSTPPNPAPLTIAAGNAISIRAGGDIGPADGEFGLFATLPNVTGNPTISPDGSEVYARLPNGNVQIIDTDSNITSAVIPSGSLRGGSVLSTDGTRLYVATTDSIRVIDTTTDTQVAQIANGSNAQNLALSPDGLTLYTTNQSGHDVSVIDLATNSVVQKIPVGLEPNGIGITPDGSKVYVVNFSSHNVSVIDTATRTVSTTVNVPSRTGFSPYPSSLTINPDGTRAYVSSADDLTITVINTATDTVELQFQAGASPLEVVFSPSGSTAYVVNNFDRTVSVVDVATHKVQSIVPIGPNAIRAALGIVGGREVLYVEGTPGSILRAMPSEFKPVLDAPSVALQSDFGTINVDVKSNILKANSGGPGSVFLDSKGPVSLLSSSAGFKFDLQSAGPITLNGALGAVNVNLATNAGNSSITINADLTALMSASIKAQGAGNVTTATTARLIAPNMVLASGSGRIEVSTSATNILANTSGAGNVIIKELDAVSIGPGDSTAGGLFQLKSAGNITVAGSISATKITLATTANNSNIYLTGSVNASDTASLSTHGNGQIFILNDVIAEFSVGSFPADLALSPSGDRLYIVNAFDGGSVSVVNTADQSLVATIPAGIHPRGVVINPQGTLAYVSVFDTVTTCCQGYTAVIDLATNKEIARITVGTHPGGIAINQDGSKVYVANNLSNSISIINTATNSVEATIPINSPRDIVINQSGTLAFIISPVNNNVSVMDLATNTITQTVPVGVSPLGITLNAQGTLAYIPNSGSDTVSVLDVTTNTIIATIPVGSAPRAVTINQTGTLAFVSNIASNNISIIDTSTQSVIATLNAGSGPNGLTTGLVGGSPVLFVTNENSGTLSIIGIPTIEAPTVSLSVQPINLNFSSLAAALPVLQPAILPPVVRQDINTLIPVGLNVNLAINPSTVLSRQNDGQKSGDSVVLAGDSGHVVDPSRYFQAQGQGTTFVLFTAAGQVFSGTLSGNGSAWISGTPGTTFSIEENTTILHAGRVFAKAMDGNVSITSRGVTVKVPAGGAAIIDAQAGKPLHVMSLTGDDPVVELETRDSGDADPKITRLNPGEELIFAEEEMFAEDMIPVDGVNHQVVGGIEVKKSRTLHSRFNVDQLSHKDPLVHRFTRLSSSQAHAQQQRDDRDLTGSVFTQSLSLQLDASGRQSEPIKFVASGNTLFRHLSDGSIELAQGAIFLHAPEKLVISTKLGDVVIKAGALVSIELRSDELRVKSCGGLNQVSVISANTKLVANLGEELIICARRPTRQDVFLPDGVGRRNHCAYSIDGDKTAVISEFSILSMLNNVPYMQSMKRPQNSYHQKILSKLIKSAAAKEIVSAHKGAYQQRKM